MSRKLRSLAALAMVAVISLISAGCGSNAPSGTGSSTATSGNNTHYEKALKFAECMRHNGVSAFPDPPASGELTIDAIANGSSLDPSTAGFKQAISACKNLQPPGFTGGKVTAQQREGRLKFAQCIRDNGVRDFPDPTPDGPLIDTNRIPSAQRNGGMTILHAAMQTCHYLAAGAGVVGR